MSIPTNDELKLMHERICSALGDPKRIQLLYTLHEKPRHVSQLAEMLDIPQPTVSRHLAVLRQRGLVSTRREGAAVIYSVAHEQMIAILDRMRELLRILLEHDTLA